MRKLCLERVTGLAKVTKSVNLELKLISILFEINTNFHYMSGTHDLVVHQNHQKETLKCRLLAAATLKVSNSVDLEWNPGIYLSNRSHSLGYNSLRTTTLLHFNFILFLYYFTFHFFCNGYNKYNIN